MKILVTVKQVPDTATKIQIRADGQGIHEEGIKWVINPYDEFAIEEALRIKEKHGGEVVVLALGPSRVEEAVRQSLAMGADRAVIVTTEGSVEPATAAHALAAICQQEGFDLIITGKQAVDDDSAQVGPMIAAGLGLPQVTVVIHLEVDEASKRLRAERELEGASEIVELPYPAVVTAQRGLNEPRYPTLPNIMKAKKKEVRRVTLESLSLPAQPWVTVNRLFEPPTRPEPTILSGDPAETAKELVRLLHNQAKVL
ncbi:electron transfer flavoprotein subunit beta/FixA family protein [Sulfobacillus sp. hq2]|uniref:Electron transfer flavoprotein subunit beta n=1 Tax=Sulfobacillus thermotolerans TaxID=338644 RepID=A0ABM6RRZ8_9FIRM|nr:electron transfer flavoprotein subunit beta/FixA family protein [Sulfobacillus sp. hq2]AUW94232.1 electron transfer flavoprotein subunit beta [Sulfobacillus thermotolerans]MCY0909262.1 electron transfer flavoprotein subunit beta/FixA family protein [Sulfobacillus thermotolerans]POB09498.1 electron transfer flavoprotein subunit beta [Sulfobacillus sp. hq2]